MQNYKSILITGANGWLGQRLVYLLVKGYKNYPMVSPSLINCLVEKNQNTTFLTKLGVNCFFGDLSKFEDCDNFSKKHKDHIIIHTAGIIHPQLFTSDFNRINYLGAKNIYETNLENNCKKFIAISSNACFGSSSKKIIFDDSTNYNPYAKYGKSKLKMELFLKNKAKESNYPNITILRPTWFYGPGQPARQTLFFQMIKNGKFPILGKGKNLRSMTYIDNLIEAIHLASKEDLLNGDSFWIADKRPYEMIEIILTIKEVLEKEFNISTNTKNLHVPSIISDLARIADLTIQSMGLYNTKIHVLSEMNQNIACNIQKAEETLMYKPTNTLYEGMKKSLDWCIENNIKI